MVVTGRINGNPSQTLDGKLVISFEVNEKSKALSEFDAIKDEPELEITAQKLRKRRSLNANTYFWQLCDKIAKRLNSTKDRIYLIQLRNYGVFIDVKVLPQAYKMLEEQFRYTELLPTAEEGWTFARCYIGSSSYDTKQMADLINGTVAEAKELGIETLTPSELQRMVDAWKGGHKTDGY